VWRYTTNPPWSPNDFSRVLECLFSQQSLLKATPINNAKIRGIPLQSFRFGSREIGARRENGPKPISTKTICFYIYFSGNKIEKGSSGNENDIDNLEKNGN
jgi:hypothetical protein